MSRRLHSHRPVKFNTCRSAANVVSQKLSALCGAILWADPSLKFLNAHCGIDGIGDLAKMATLPAMCTLCFCITRDVFPSRRGVRLSHEAGFWYRTCLSNCIPMPCSLASTSPLRRCTTSHQIALWRGTTQNREDRRLTNPATQEQASAKPASDVLKKDVLSPAT